MFGSLHVKFCMLNMHLLNLLVIYISKKRMTPKYDPIIPTILCFLLHVYGYTYGC